MLSGFLRKGRALVVLLTLDNLTWHHLHDIIAAARDEVRVLLHNLLRLLLLDLCTFIRSKELVKLGGRNWNLTTRTLDFLAVGQFIFALITQAVNMNLMETICSLKHRHIVVFHVDI